MFDWIKSLFTNRDEIKKLKVAYDLERDERIALQKDIVLSQKNSLPHMYVKLPDWFIATKYDGYFINIDDIDPYIYSIKSGVLRKLKKHKNYDVAKKKVVPGYHFCISHNGRRVYITKDDIELWKKWYELTTVKVVK